LLAAVVDVKVETELVEEEVIDTELVVEVAIDSEFGDEEMIDTGFGEAVDIARVARQGERNIG